jgi:hypothetical protein
VQEVAFEFELLVVVYAVQDVCGYFQQFLDQFLIGHVCGFGVDAFEHFGVAFEGFFLKFFVGVDLIAFGFEYPAECFGVHVVDVSLVEFEGVAVVVEHFVVVYFRYVYVFAEEELGSLGVLFRFDAGEFEIDFGLLVVGFAFAGGREVA